MDLDWGRITNIGGGVLLVALGVWVATRRPFRRANLFFALFVGGFALGPALYNLSFVALGRFTIGFQLAVEATFVIAVAGLIGTAWTSPIPVRQTDGRRIAIAAIVGLGFALIQFASDIGYNLVHGWNSSPTYEPAPAWITSTYDLGYDLVYGLTWGVLLLFALRSRTTADPKLRASYALLGIGLVLYPAFNGAAQLLQERTPILAQLTTAVALVVASAWLWNTRSGPNTASARTAALVTLAMPAAGLVAAATVGYEGLTPFGVFGLLRIVSGIILAYAILKHQLLGIDVKLRFAIKTSTVAGVFLAVLFIVANIAQNFFGQYGVVLGGAAAGMLFFVMAPIQRAAERLANKAVPVEGLPSGGGSRAEESYLNVLRRYLRDGVLSRDEERSLAHLAGELRIDAGRAFELREVVEAEAR